MSTQKHLVVQRAGPAPSSLFELGRASAMLGWLPWDVLAAASGAATDKKQVRLAVVNLRAWSPCCRPCCPGVHSRRAAHVAALAPPAWHSAAVQHLWIGRRQAKLRTSNSAGSHSGHSISSHLIEEVVPAPALGSRADLNRTGYWQVWSCCLPVQVPHLL